MTVESDILAEAEMTQESFDPEKMPCKTGQALKKEFAVSS